MNGRTLGSIWLITALATYGGGALSQDAPAVSPTVVALDAETTIGDVAIGCTGIGQSKDDARWKAYPVRLEFANPAGDLLANEVVKLSTNTGRVLAVVSCEGPWIMVRAAAGTYKVDAWIPGAEAKHQIATFSPPAKGLRIVSLRFPEA